MSKVPKGWIVTTLDQVCDVNGGIQKQAKRRPVENKFPFLRVANVGRGTLDLSEVHEVELFDGEIERFRLKAGDLLVVEGNGSPDQIGRAATWKGAIPDAVHQNHLIRVRPTAAIDPKFLELLWNSPLVALQLMSVAQSSSGLYTLSTAKLKRVQLALPPLTEQHRIVEALEEQLSRLDAAAASVEQGLRRSQTLLRAVVDSELCSVSSSPKMLLGNVLSEPLRNGHSAKATIDPNGVRTLSLTAVTSGEFSDANTKLTVADRDRVKGLWLEPQDLLIQRSNTPELVGTAALFTGALNWAIFPDLLIRVRLNSRVMPEFVLLELQSKRGRSYFKGRAKGLAGSMPKIDQAAIEGFEISVPALEVQKRIVQRVADERERISRLAAELVKARRRGGSLRNGLLRKAFAGGLVAQDPADEPAATLLDRIAAEREAAKPARKAAKPTARPRKATAAAAKAAPAPTPAPSASVQQELFVQ